MNGWMTIPVAAERFGVARGRLQQAALRGALPAKKLGAGRTLPWLVRAEDVERFLATTRRGPKPKGQRPN